MIAEILRAGPVRRNPESVGGATFYCLPRRGAAISTLLPDVRRPVLIVLAKVANKERLQEAGSGESMPILKSILE
jgi:hypothetical protein